MYKKSRLATEFPINDHNFEWKLKEENYIYLFIYFHICLEYLKR